MFKQKKSCINCRIGKTIAVNNDILCKYRGVVSLDYVCSKYKYRPEVKPFNDTYYKCIDCENFILDASNSKGTSAVGLCNLFSVRQYNGKQKNACSKFVRKPAQVVS